MNFELGDNVEDDLGKVTGFQMILSPSKGDTMQYGSIVVHDFEDAYCEGKYDSEGGQEGVVITHVKKSQSS